MNRPCVFVWTNTRLMLKQLSFTEEVNTAGNLRWMLGCLGLPRRHVHYRSRTTFVYFFASDLYPACLCCGKALGMKDKENLIKVQVLPSHQSLVFLSTRMS